MGGAAAAAISDPRPRPWEEEGVAEVEKAVKDAEAGADHQPHEGELVKIKVAKGGRLLDVVVEYVRGCTPVGFPCCVCVGRDRAPGAEKERD